MKLDLQMLNDASVKRSWDSLRCKYQLKQITKTREKIVGANENCILRKMNLNFKPCIQTDLQNSLPEQAKVVE